MALRRRRTFRLALVLTVTALWSAMSAASNELPLNHPLRDKWFASKAAINQGFPATIEIMNFGRASVDSRSCEWVWIGSANNLSIECEGMEPFTLRLRGSRISDVAFATFGHTPVTSAECQQPTPRMIRQGACRETIGFFYATAAGKERLQQGKPDLQKWGSESTSS
jgi:hypothetical protein